MDAGLVASWEGLCQQLAPAFTRPTFVTFLHLATGWALCRSRPAVTNLVLTVGGRLLGHAAKHWTTYERFFRRAAWSLADVSRLLLARVAVPLVDDWGVGGAGGPVDLNVDDTTCGRYGKRVAFAGYFKDASASNAMKKVCHWSHNWVVGCVTFRCRRWPDWVVGLPVLFSLYRKPGECGRRSGGEAFRDPFRSRHELAAGMLKEARAALPGRRLRVVADGQYATKVLCGAVDRAAGESLVSRIRCDAALYALPPRNPRRVPGRPGPPPLKGKRLPTPRRMAARRKKGWERVQVLAYGRRVEKLVLAVVCLWPRVCKYHPIKLLIVRDPAGGQRDDFFFCTDPTAADAEVVERFAARWPVEECVRDAKQHGGLERVQGWCPRTVVRQAPVALVVQTLVKAWFIRRGAAAARPGGRKSCPWLREDKAHPSYLDMLAALRRAVWEDRIHHNSTPAGRVRGLWKLLQFTPCAAA